MSAQSYVKDDVQETPVPFGCPVPFGRDLERSDLVARRFDSCSYMQMKIVVVLLLSNVAAACVQHIPVAGEHLRDETAVGLQRICRYETFTSTVDASMQCPSTSDELMATHAAPSP
jgi:hypothetical protein